MIPKILHFMWVGGEMPLDYRENVRAWQSENPGWRVMLWVDDNIPGLIGENYPGFLEVYEKLDMPIKKADLARLLVSHHYGGLYLDCDLVPVMGVPGKSRLGALLSSGVIYNRGLKEGSPLPEVPSQDKIDLTQKELVLSREHCHIDRMGHGIANGMILARPGARILMEFVERQKHAHRGLVLDYVGTWALTRFLRMKMEEEGDRLRKEMTVLPPHYFLWEDEAMRCDPPDYAVSKHPWGKSDWGDHSKQKWWKI